MDRTENNHFVLLTGFVLRRQLLDAALGEHNGEDADLVGDDGMVLNKHGSLKNRLKKHKTMRPAARR